MCPANYFKKDTSLECIPCPEGSTAPNGSTAHENCKCEVGELFEKNGELKLDRRKGLTPVWCCFGDAQVIVLEIGQGALKEHSNRHHSNVCNNSKRIAIKNSIDQHKPNSFLDRAEFLQLPVVFLGFGIYILDEELWMPSSSSASSKHLCTMRGSTLGLCRTRFNRPHRSSTAGLRPFGQQDPGVWMFTPSRTVQCIRAGP